MKSEIGGANSEKMLALVYVSNDAAIVLMERVAMPRRRIRPLSQQGLRRCRCFDEVLAQKASSSESLRCHIQPVPFRAKYAVAGKPNTQKIGEDHDG